MIGVVDSGVEDKMRELMGDDDADPARVDLAGRDQREQCADGRHGLAPHVFAGARPKRIVEGLLVRIDEEVDRFLHGHAEQLARVVDRFLANRQRSLPERGSALVPVNSDDRAGASLPVESGVGVEHRDLRAGLGGAVSEGQSPARLDTGVRLEARLAQVQLVAKGLRQAVGNRDLVRFGAQGARKIEQHFCAFGRSRQPHRLVEDDRNSECRRYPGSLERDRRRRSRARPGQEDRECQEGGGCQSQPSPHCCHARPARRRNPRPF